MRIRFRIVCQRDAIAALASDREVAGAVDLDAAAFGLDSDDPLFGRFLDLTRGTSGCWLNPVMAFTRAEIARSRLLQLEGRKLLRERPEDYEVNIARLRELPFIVNGPFRIKLLDRFALSRATLRPNETALAGDWTAEHVVARGVARTFETEGLAGFSARPVFVPESGRRHEDLLLLYTEHVLPRAELDLTTPPFGAGEGGCRQLGCLTYDFRDVAPPASDFFRTAENWSSNDLPVWVVSARVREVFTRHHLRGWAFRPVLEKDTELHHAYLATWQDLAARISASNAGHFF